MEFNSGESANDDDDPHTGGHFEAQAETHELDMADGNTDAVEMHRLDRPTRGQNNANENSNGSSSGSSNDEEDSEERSGVRTSSPPFLLVPEEDLELGRSSIGNVQL